MPGAPFRHLTIVLVSMCLAYRFGNEAVDREQEEREVSIRDKKR